MEPTVDEILAVPPPGESAAEMEVRWGEAHRRGPMLWGYWVVGALLLATAAVWSVRTLLAHKEVRQEVIREAAILQQEEAAREAEARGLVDAIEKRVEAYLAAPNPDALLQHVRRRGHVEPLIKDWYRRNEYQAASVESIPTLQPVSLDGRPFWVMQTETAGGGQRNLLIEQDEAGGVWVDWETDVCYQPLAWDEFVARRPEGLYDFRVIAAEDTYFSHEFKSSDQFLCLRLTAKGSGEFLFGYVRRGTADEKAVREAIAASGGQPVSLILKLGYLPGSPARRSVSVVSVIATRWCIVN